MTVAEAYDKWMIRKTTWGEWMAFRLDSTRYAYFGSWDEAILAVSSDN
jgi:hypothetical protein